MKALRFSTYILVFVLCCRFTKFQVKQANDAPIQGPCAVFVAPTPEQIDSLKVKLGDEKFYTVADDNMLYISKSRTFLEGKKVTIINKDALGTIKFKKADGKIVEQKLMGMMWSVILFNGKSDPIVANMPDLEKDYNAYMK